MLLDCRIAVREEGCANDNSIVVVAHEIFGTQTDRPATPIPRRPSN